MKSAIALLLMASTLAFGQATSFVGTLDPADDNAVVLITFHLAAPANITAQSWGAGGSAGAPGGKNAAGTVIPAGGFDPYFSLFSGAGPAATLIHSNDDGACPPATLVSGSCLDSSLQNIPLPAGDYTLAVSVFQNMSFAENLGAGTLGDGFIGIGNYYSTVGGMRTSNYAVDLSAAAQVINVTTISGEAAIPSAPLAPTLTKTFTPPVILAGGVSQLKLVMHNPNSAPIFGAFFTDTLPATLRFAAPLTTSAVGCGSGAVVFPAAPAADVIQLTNGEIAANSNCIVTVNVTAAQPGSINNLIPASAYGRTVVGFPVSGTAPVTADLTVIGPPALSKAFGAPTLVLGDATTLTFTVHNPNPVGIQDVAFTDALPAGLKIATPNGLNLQGCGAASVTAPAGGSSIAVSSAAVAGSLIDCVIQVKVLGAALGVAENVTSPVTANTSGTLRPQLALSGPPATATVTVVSPLEISKEFSPSSIPLASTTVLTIRVKNLGPVPVTNVAFTDAMPSSLVITSNGDIQSAGCGASAAGPAETSNISLTGGAIAAKSVCTITVTVQGLAPGAIQNTTSPVTGTANALAVSADPATATLQVGASQVSFLIRYASNLTIGDSVINITNVGNFSSQVGLATGGAQNGNLCANVYTYSPDEQLVSCCSCLVTPNALNSLSVNNDLASNPLTPVRPTSVVIKMVASAPSAAGVCNPATVTRAGEANYLAPGLEAWGTALHPLPVTAGSVAGTFGLTETPFIKGQISDAELKRVTQLCAFIQANGSGYGICKSCRLGGLGAASR